MRKRLASGPRGGLHPGGRFTPARYRAPMSLRLRGHGPLLLGDMLAYPDLAAGLDLEALPLWASLVGLAAANVAVLALVLAGLRTMQDGSEPLTLVKVQVAMLERQPQLQSKLSQLSSMIQMGQQGAWLILEEAVLELLKHQSRITYASVTSQMLSSKKRAYAEFGALAELEGAKANMEEAVVRHMGETSDDEADFPARTLSGPRTARPGGGLFGGLMGGLGLGGPPPKELTVVTLILATRGRLDLPDNVTDWGGLRQALQQMTGLSSDRIMAVELVWTPRSETDYLTRQQLESDYPELRLLEGTGSAGGRGVAAK